MWTTILSYVLPLLTKGKGFFATHKKSILVAALIAVLFLINIVQYKSNREVKKELAVSEQNVKAATDSVRITKDKAGKDESDHLAFYVTKNSELEKINKDLADEVKNTKGKVTTIVKEHVKIVTDTIEVAAKTTVDTINNQAVVKTDFALDTVYNPGNFRKLKGFTTYNSISGISNATINTDEIGIAIVTGIKNVDKGKPEIFVRSNYPNFVVTDIQGAVLDPNLFKKSHPSLLTASINIGWVPITYDWVSKDFSTNTHRIGVSAGIGINIVRLFKK